MSDTSVFPSLETIQDGRYGTRYLLVGGMTLRDCFALKALSAFSERFFVDDEDGAADICYKMADALLKARDKIADDMLKEREKKNEE